MKSILRSVTVAAFAVAGIYVLTAQDSKPSTPANPAAQTAREEYEYKLVMVDLPVPPAHGSSTPVDEPILDSFSQWEIVDVQTLSTPARSARIAGGPQATRQILAYTLRKLRLAR